MSNIVVSGSYVQDKRHALVTERYNPIQPSAVGEAMANAGLTLATLSTGKARHEDKVDFQRTLARYRGPEISEGIHLDIVYDSKKLGRGVDRVLLGIYRMVCTNGLFVGSNFFKHDIRHSGNTLDSLTDGIALALSKQAEVTETIKFLRAREFTAEECQNLANEAAKLVAPSEAIQIAHRLLKPRRQVDDSRDAWTIFNVVQENAVSGGSVAYTLNGQDNQGRPTLVKRTARAIKPNTGKDASFNQALFDLALKHAA